jgi:hypothetical protein
MRNKNLYKYLLAGGAAYLLYFLFFRKKKAQLLERMKML